MISAQTKKFETPRQISCPCLRPKGRVFCTKCGFITGGRVVTQCQSHSNVIFINEYDKCPRCLVHHLWLKEI